MPYKRGPKWVGQVRKTHNEREYKREKKFSSKAEAQAWEVEMRKKPVTDWNPRIGTDCLGNWAQDYLDFAKEKFVEKTYKEKSSAFRRFFKEVDPTLPTTDLTPKMVLDYVIKQNKVRTGNAANKDRKNLQAAWNWGIKYMEPRLPKDNPCEVERMPADPHPRYIPPEADFWKVLEAAEQEQDRVMLLTCLLTAGRKGELFRLKWSDVDFERGIITLWTRKRKSGNLEPDPLPMTSDLAATLSWWKGATPFPDKENVFLSLDDTPFCREYYGEAFTIRLQFMRRLCERAGVKRFGFHAIRHLTASVLYRRGEPVSVIQAVLRHQNPTTTNRYLRSLGLEEVRGALEAFSSSDRSKVVDLMPKLAGRRLPEAQNKKPSEEPSAPQTAKAT